MPKDVEEESDVKAKKGEVNLVEETIKPMAVPPTMPAERQTEYVIGPFRRFQFWTFHIRQKLTYKYFIA